MKIPQILFHPKIQKKLNAKGGGIGFVVPDNWADFARTCKIRSGLRFVFFDPYQFQKDLISIIEKQKFTIAAKTRQIGITELISNYFVYRALQNPAFVAIILSKTQNDTSAIAKRVRKQLFPFSSKGLLSFDSDSLTDLQITGGGRLLFRNSSPNGIRGIPSVTAILYDEAAFIENSSLIFEAMLPTLELSGDDARCVIVSTPNGRSGLFYDLLSSGNGENDLDRHISEIQNDIGEKGFRCWVDNSGWAKVLLHWKAHPVFSLIENYLEKKQTELKLSSDATQREFNLSFDASDQSVFSYNLVELAARGSFERFDKDKNRRYFMGVDLSSVGQDYTVAIVLSEDHGQYNVAVMYRERKKTFDANLFEINKLIALYSPSRVAVEANGIGALYLEKLSESNPSAIIKAIQTTGVSKPVMVERLIHALEKKIISFPPGAISDELKTFSRKEGKLEAASGQHDDCVMSLCFALAVSPFATGDNSVIEIPTYRRDEI
jgi:phage FluMu gp28-like protein